MVLINESDARCCGNKKQSKTNKSGFAALSFFSGCGGLDLGAESAGVKVLFSTDFDKDCVDTLNANHSHLPSVKSHEDFMHLDKKNIDQIIKKQNPDKVIVLGGPPCQPFSKASYWQTHKNRLGSDDPRNMIGPFLKYIQDVKPDGFILENVESLLHPKNEVFVNQMEEQIEKFGFIFKRLKINCADFGVPQKRKRIFYICMRKGNNFKYDLEPTHFDPRKQRNLELFQSSLLPYEKVKDWIDEFKDSKFSDGYDSAEGKYYQELLKVPAGKNYMALEELTDEGDPIFKKGSRYWTFLLKLHPDLPSPTIISAPGHWEGPFHWENRRLRIKELAAIQTFPASYNFKGSRRSIIKQIGNAVPPLAARKIVENLVTNLE